MIHSRRRKRFLAVDVVARVGHVERMAGIRRGRVALAILLHERVTAGTAGGPRETAIERVHACGLRVVVRAVERLRVRTLAVDARFCERVGVRTGFRLAANTRVHVRGRRTAVGQGTAAVESEIHISKGVLLVNGIGLCAGLRGGLRAADRIARGNDRRAVGGRLAQAEGARRTSARLGRARRARLVIGGRERPANGFAGAGVARMEYLGGIEGRDAVRLAGGRLMGGGGLVLGGRLDRVIAGERIASFAERVVRVVGDRGGERAAVRVGTRAGLAPLVGAGGGFGVVAGERVAVVGRRIGVGIGRVVGIGQATVASLCQRGDNAAGGRNGVVASDRVARVGLGDVAAGAVDGLRVGAVAVGVGLFQVIGVGARLGVAVLAGERVAVVGGGELLGGGGGEGERAAGRRGRRGQYDRNLGATRRRSPASRRSRDEVMEDVAVIQRWAR